MLPDFSLPTTDGRPIRLSDYRNRRNIVLVLLRGLSAASETLLADLQDNVTGLAEDNAQALVVVQGPRQAAVSLQRMYLLSYPVLYDEQGQLEALLGPSSTPDAPRLAVHIASRSSRIYWSAWAEPGDPAPTVEDIRGWLEFIEIQCPECEAPEWAPTDETLKPASM